MTKPVRSNKTKGIVAKSQKDAYYSKIKLLTKFLFDPSRDKLNIILQNKEDVKKLKYFVYRYFITQPKLLVYLNKYLNDLFTFESYDPEHFFNSISQIINIYGITSSNQLHFSSYKTDEFNDFNKTVLEYNDLLNNNHISPSEMRSLYILYQKGIIDENEIESMKSLIDGKEKKSSEEKKIEQFINIPVVNENQSEELSPLIKDLISGLKNFISKRNICMNCPMHSRGAVILDTNLEKPGTVDISFQGLNPGKEEKDNDKPFTGPAGKLLRPFIKKLVNEYNMSYLITNTILCYSNNTNEIPNLQNVVKNCSSIVNSIHKEFPARIKVLIGAEAMKAYDIPGTITKNNGTFINDYFIMIHPSAILRNPKNLKLFEQAWQNLFGYINSEKYIKPIKNITVDSSINFKIPPNKIIKKSNNNLTLFDLKILGENVIYIFVDKDGNKFYMLDENVQFPVYLKSGSYKECDYVIDKEKIEAVAYLTSEQREQLNKRLYQNLKKTTN